MPEDGGVAERLVILNRARDFEDLLSSSGWKHVYDLHVEWVEAARKELRNIDTANSAESLDALRRWQIAEKFIEMQAVFINQTLAMAEDIRGATTLEEALLREKLQHEQSEPGNPAHRTGY